MKYFRCKYNITKYTTLTQSILVNRYADRKQNFQFSLQKKNFSRFRFWILMFRQVRQETTLRITSRKRGKIDQRRQDYSKVFTYPTWDSCYNLFRCIRNVKIKLSKFLTFQNARKHFFARITIRSNVTKASVEILKISVEVAFAVDLTISTTDTKRI